MLGTQPRSQSLALNDPGDARFRLRIGDDKWGYSFTHRHRTSAIHVVDLPMIDSRDDHSLLSSTPPLSEIGALVRQLERQHHLQFQRLHAVVETDLPGAAPVVRAWVMAL